MGPEKNLSECETFPLDKLLLLCLSKSVHQIHHKLDILLPYSLGLHPQLRKHLGEGHHRRGYWHLHWVHV